MRIRTLTAAAVLTGGLAAVPVSAAHAAPSGAPAAQPEATTAVCTLGTGDEYAIVVNGAALIEAGTGGFVQAVLDPGQGYTTAAGTYVVFNRDGTSFTYRDLSTGRLVTEVCS